MAQTAEELLLISKIIEPYKKTLSDHKNVFEWIKDNPSASANTIRHNILCLLDKMNTDNQPSTNTIKRKC